MGGAIYTVFGPVALPDRRNCYQIRHSERQVDKNRYKWVKWIDINGKVWAMLLHTTKDGILFQDCRGMVSTEEILATNLAKT